MHSMCGASMGGHGSALKTVTMGMISDLLYLHYPPSTAEVLLASIQGQLDEWDATEPYPDERDFQMLLSDKAYPILTLMKAVEGENSCRG